MGVIKETLLAPENLHKGKALELPVFCSSLPAISRACMSAPFTTEGSWPGLFSLPLKELKKKTGKIPATGGTSQPEQTEWRVEG